MQIETLREIEQRAIEFAQALDRDGSFGMAGCSWHGRFRTIVGEVFLRVERLEDVLERLHFLANECFRDFILNHATLHQFICPELAGGGMLLDPLVHQGLSEIRLVPFVMTVAAIANQVDDEVFLETAAISTGHPAQRRCRLLDRRR